ncbi:hypothetical protein LZ32DRAFT_602206 [Colletotrichum eremochloae]|nr:hypothetical protein LZ32DRAFT_602206 [Colletotrichum eremochloae]
MSSRGVRAISFRLFRVPLGSAAQCSLVLSKCQGCYAPPASRCIAYRYFERGREL